MTKQQLGIVSSTDAKRMLAKGRKKEAKSNCQSVLPCGRGGQLLEQIRGDQLLLVNAVAGFAVTVVRMDKKDEKKKRKVVLEVATCARLTRARHE